MTQSFVLLTTYGFCTGSGIPNDVVAIDMSDKDKEQPTAVATACKFIILSCSFLITVALIEKRELIRQERDFFNF